jgi:nucleotide-binding universal stress UspA family protein
VNILLFVADEQVPDAAVSLAGYLAELTDSAVTLLFVTPEEVDDSAEAGSLSQVIEQLPGVDVDVHLRHGKATGQLVEEARDETYDLIVMAMRHISHLRRRLTGSRSRTVLRRGLHSVLIAKQDDPELKRILICTSGAEIAEHVIEAGAQLANLAGAQVTLLHVGSSFPRMYSGLPKIQETLAELMEADTPLAHHLDRGKEILSRQNLSFELLLRRGVVADEIVQESLDGDYDLIVIGASAPGGQLQALLLGEVAWEVVQQAACHVLVVKHADLVFDDEGE